MSRRKEERCWCGHRSSAHVVGQRGIGSHCTQCTGGKLSHKYAVTKAVAA